MLFIGCDPDLHNTSFAVVDEAKVLRGVFVAKVPKEIKGRDALVPAAVAIKNLFDESEHPSDFPRAWHEQVGCVAIESQELAYSAAAGVPPGDVALIADVSGAATSFGIILWKCPMLRPAPQAWKGSRPKQVHQMHICDLQKWEYTKHGGKKQSRAYVVPKFPDGYPPVLGVEPLLQSDWKHVMDAIGLALYAKERYDYVNRVKGYK